MDKTLKDSVRYLAGIGPKKSQVLSNAGINNIEDLLYYFPKRYEDRTKFVPIRELKEGEFQTIKAEILAKGQRQSWKRRQFNIFELAVSDSSARISCVWFNQPYLRNYFKVGQTLILYGRIERYSGRLQLVSPEFEIISVELSPGEASGESLDIGRITPVYPLPSGFSQRTFRRTVRNALEEFLPKIRDFISFDIRSKNNFLNLAKSLKEVHFPQNFDLQKQAYQRLCFDEFYLFQILLALRKSKKQEKKGITHKTEGPLIQGFIEGLIFKLTKSQENVLKEISSDMSKYLPMQRLLQGDVGSGKTIVATVAALTAIQGGYQVAFMVPTEILAGQHFKNIKYQISNIKSNKKDIKVGLFSGSLNKQEKEKVSQEIRDGDIDLIIGTHALLGENVKFNNLGLVVIDEQHKFGVGQRALLPQKSLNPDVLIMTATPIPRTLAITLYGDLDISVIKELPPGRLPIKTVSFSMHQQARAFSIAKEQLALGRQAYIVYPVIEESYALDILGAKKMYEILKNGEFKDYSVGLIHGKLKQPDQDKIMQKFKNKEINILVTTTVLEVGMDIPEATCMIIEHAERFGLSQLHQLRGRIGRGPYQSVCLLLADPVTDESKARIKAMLTCNDGFRIAEEDLKIRGPGEFFGLRQHGLADLKIANPLTQLNLLKKAREEAIKLVAGDTRLELDQNLLLKEELLKRFPDYQSLVTTG